MPTRRQRQVAELIHREISTLLMFEARDPRLAGVTITDVEVTKDLLLARIYFTVLGTERADADAAGAMETRDREAEASAGFEHAAGYLRTELARRIQLRFAPELQFRVDTSAAYARRIESVLDQLQPGSQGVDDSGSA